MSPIISSQDIQTREIGDELASLIKTHAALPLVLCQFGAIEQLADLPGPLEDFLASVFVRPMTTEFPNLTTMGPPDYEVVERFKILYSFSTRTAPTDVPTKASDDMGLIVAGLGQDVKLTNISTQVAMSRPISVSWEPPEKGLLLSMGVSVNVVSLIYQVTWLAR